MAGEPDDPQSSERLLGHLLRRSREPFLSTIESQGFATAVEILIRAARRIVESNPDELGGVVARGTRDEGAIWLAGEDAERVREESGYDPLGDPSLPAALIAARVFGAIAYRHPYFDGNKRTAFMASMLAGAFLGFRIKPLAYPSVETEVLALTAQEAADPEVADWLLRKVFLPPDKRR